MQYKYDKVLELAKSKFSGEDRDFAIRHINGRKKGIDVDDSKANKDFDKEGSMTKNKDEANPMEKESQEQIKEKLAELKGMEEGEKDKKDNETDPKKEDKKDSEKDPFEGASLDELEEHKKKIDNLIAAKKDKKDSDDEKKDWGANCSKDEEEKKDSVSAKDTDATKEKKEDTDMETNKKIDELQAKVDANAKALQDARDEQTYVKDKIEICDSLGLDSSHTLSRVMKDAKSKLDMGNRYDGLSLQDALEVIKDRIKLKEGELRSQRAMTDSNGGMATYYMDSIGGKQVSVVKNPMSFVATQLKAWNLK